MIPPQSATSGSRVGVGSSFPCHGRCCAFMIFGMLGLSRMVFVALNIILMRHVLFRGSRFSAPSWRIGRYGMMSTQILTCLLLLVKHGCMVWISAYVAAYAKACSLLPPREPFSWSWTSRLVALEEDEASCKWRQAPVVNFSGGKPLLLSYSYVWPGIRAFS